MSDISQYIKNSVVIKRMSPLEIFSYIGNFSYMISCSLHGAIFAYIHNVPFMLHDKTNVNGDDKCRGFMEDRNLVSDLFVSFNDMKNIWGNNKDYSQLISHDQETLREHIYKFKCLLS